MSVHRETFTALVAQQDWRKGAELGVDKGILFSMLLRTCPDLQLLGVDIFPDKDRAHRVPDLVSAFAPRARVLEMLTTDASAHVGVGELDFVFIDADHTEQAVALDIAAWQDKIRPGGWLGGHDYSKKFPGVIKAVNRAFYGRVEHWPGDIWGVWV